MIDSSQRASRGNAWDTCPICESSAALEGNVVSCSECGLSLTVLDSDGMAAGTDSDLIEYPESGHALLLEVEEQSFWFQHRNRVLAAVLQRYPPSGTIWDVGGGNGFQARHLQSEGHEVVMVEPGPVGCANAHARGVRRIVRSTLEELSLPTGSLAALGYFDVLEHLETPRPLLEESLRVLREGGRVYIAVPAFNWLWSQEDVYAQHKRRYTAKALRQDLMEAGFEIDYLSYYFLPLVAPIFFLRALPFRLMPGKSPAESRFTPSEHSRGGFARAALDYFLDREHRSLMRGARGRFGSSILCVGRRP